MGIFRNGEIMIRTAIVEDNAAEAEALISIIKRYEKNSGQKFEIRTFENAIRFLDQYQPDYELIFMDIDMPYVNGIEASKKLRDVDENVVIVFVTALAQYAVQGYGVGALDFMLKPINYSIFELKMARAINAINKNKGKQIVIRSENRIKVIDVKTIIYIEMYNHYLHFHLEGDTNLYKMRGTLQSAKELLGDLFFEECNKGILVNLAKVSGIEGFRLLLTNGEELSISRAKKSIFLQRLAEYHGDWKLNFGRLS